MITKNEYSLSLKPNRDIFVFGIKNGIPISLGYFAVAFSLGIAAKKAGLTAIEGFITSLLCNASAGEYVGFTLIAANALYFEIAFGTLVANARYLLMSCAISQRMSPDLSIFHRMGVAFCLTDEIFGITIARPDYINPNYTYGAMVISTLGWSTGTALGIIAGNLLPLRIVSAFSVALYGMFLAIIIPPARKNKTVLFLITLAFILSYTASIVPVISTLSEGTRTIILTLVISVGAAFFFPVDDTKDGDSE